LQYLLLLGYAYVRALCEPYCSACL